MPLSYSTTFGRGVRATTPDLAELIFICTWASVSARVAEREKHCRTIRDLFPLFSPTSEAISYQHRNHHSNNGRRCFTFQWSCGDLFNPSRLLLLLALLLLRRVSGSSTTATPATHLLWRSSPILLFLLLVLLVEVSIKPKARHQFLCCILD